LESGFPKKVRHGGSAQLDNTHDCTNIIDFSANLNPFPPDLGWKPDWDMISAYPDDSYNKLKNAAAREFGCKEDEICVGNGSIEVIRSFFYATINKGEMVRTDRHTFGEYALSINLAGGTCTYEDKKDVKVRVICNPNNPTGRILSQKEMSDIAIKESTSGVRLFVDEAFNELSDGAETLIGKGYPNVFVSRSLTKSFAVPGLRIGFGFGEPELIEKIEIIRPPWTLNGFAENFALLAIEHYDELEKSRRLIKTERKWLCKKFEEIGIDYIPSRVNFILLNIKQDSGQFTENLLKQGIFVRDCSSFGLPESIRVAVRTREENKSLVEALTRCFH